MEAHPAIPFGWIAAITGAADGDVENSPVLSLRNPANKDTFGRDMAEPDD